MTLLLLSIATAKVAAAADQIVLLTSSGKISAEIAELETQLVMAVRGQLRELDVAVVVLPTTLQAPARSARRAREVGLANDAIGVIWFERSTAGLDVFLYELDGDHLYARRLPGTDSAVASSEEVAIMLRSAVSAILHGKAVGMLEVTVPERAADARPASAQASEPAAETAKQASAREALVRMGVSYVGTLFSLAAPFQHGLGVSAGLHPGDSPLFVGLSYAYFPPLWLSGPELTTRARRRPGELYGGAELSWKPFWFVTEAALVGDYVERTTHVAGPGLTAAAPSNRWLWAFSTRLGGAVTIGENARFTAKVGAEFLLNPYDQVVRDSGEVDEVVASPMPTRPRVELGLSVGLW